MINHEGRPWGTATELATRLGPDVTPAMIRRWRERDDLPTVRLGRQVYSPLHRAATIERDKRLNPRGRPRQLDATTLAA